MTADRKRGKGLTRSATVALKAGKLAEALGEPIPGHAVDPKEAAAPPALADSTEVGVSALATLDAEIRLLRAQLAEKTAAHRLLRGGNQTRESGTVAKVLALLSMPDGVPKARLIAETGAKKGYVDALLNRILPARGYELHSFPFAGSRTRAYRLAAKESVESVESVDSSEA